MEINTYWSMLPVNIDSVFLANILTSLNAYEFRITRIRLVLLLALAFPLCMLSFSNVCGVVGDEILFELQIFIDTGNGIVLKR